MLIKISQYLLNNPAILLSLSNLEDRILKKELDSAQFSSPIYISGLARSGTTLLLEFLAKSDLYTTHRYSDFPFIYTPFFWHKIRSILSFAFKDEQKHEREHKDGMMVNSESPESMEEIIWAYFTKDLADSSLNQDNENLIELVSSSYSNEQFEQFYLNHIRKLLITRKKQRYLSKANYNLARMPYLKKIIPQMKSVVMYRNPVSFIASSIKQDNLFKLEQGKNPEKLIYTNLCKHFEFGLNKKPINFSDNQIATAILDKICDSNKTNQVEGWALYWNEAYKFVLRQLEQDPDLIDSITLLSYDKLCDNPKKLLTNVNSFCGAELDVNKIDAFSKSIKKPSYYKVDFLQEELDVIRSITSKTLKDLDNHPISL